MWALPPHTSPFTSSRHSLSSHSQKCPVTRPPLSLLSHMQLPQWQVPVRRYQTQIKAHVSVTGQEFAGACTCVCSVWLVVYVQCTQRAQVVCRCVSVRIYTGVCRRNKCVCVLFFQMPILRFPMHERVSATW